MWGNPYLNFQFQYFWIWIINIVLFSIPIFLNWNLNFQSQYSWIWPTFQRVVYCTLPYQSWSNQHLSIFQRVYPYQTSSNQLYHIWPTFQRVVYCTLPYQSWSNQHLSTFQRVYVFLHIVLYHIKPAFINLPACFCVSAYCTLPYQTSIYQKLNAVYLSSNIQF